MGRLRDHEDQIGVEELQIEIGRGPTRAHFSGEVRDLIGSPEVEVAARVELSNTRVLAPLFEFELPELGPLRGSASLRTTNGDFHLEGLDVEVGGDGSAVVRARGSVSDLRGLREVSLDVSAASDDVRDLVPFLDAERFSFGPVRARARVVGAADALHVESIDAEAGRRNALWTHVTGRVGVLSGDLDLDLVVRFEAAHARELERILAIDLPDLGPVSGSAEIRGTGFRADAERIEVRCGTRNGIWLEATGAVRDLAGAARARLRGRFGAAETRLIEPLLGHELPALGRIEGSAELVRTKERIELNQFRVRSERDDGLQIRIEGESFELPISGEADLRVELRAPRLSTLSTLVDQDLPDVGPVRASGRLLTAADRWALHDFEAKLGETTLSGSASRVIAADARPRLSIELASPRVHLAPREAATPRPRPDSDDGWWERPIPLDALGAMDADLVLRADELTGTHDLRIEDLILHVALDEGVLTVDPLSFRFQGGMVNGEARLNSRPSKPSWELRGDGHGIDLARVASQFTDREIMSGQALVSFDLFSRGSSGSELLRGLDGDLTFVLREGHIASDYALLLQKDMLSALAFKGSVTENPLLNCLIVDLGLRRGVAEFEQVFVDGEHAYLHVTGKVDFRKRRYDLLMTPKVKKPRLFSVIVPVTVTGPLDAPVILPSKTSIARDASVALAGNLIVPGVGLLAPFLRIGTLGRDPCARGVEAYLSVKQAGASAEAR
jgi:hypothetical protein